MKSMWRMVVICLLSLAWQSPAWALRCYMPRPENATNLYLVQLNDVAMENPESGTAQLHVLEVYRGDPQELSRIQQAYIRQSCNDIWGPPCPVQQKFFAGQYWILVDAGAYSRPNQEEPVALLWSGKCPSGDILISTQQQLEAFEQQFPEVWTSPEFKGIEQK